MRDAPLWNTSPTWPATTQEPLRTVTAHVQLLERLLAPPLDQHTRERFAFIVEGARRMSALIDGLPAYPPVGRAAAEYR